MEIEKSYRFRLRILYGILCAALALFTAVLYDAQIIRGQAYYEQSTSRIPSYETVEASRGIITDRNGKVLVSNRQVYTLTLDASLLGEDPNGAILRLLKLCRSYGVTWTDNLPLRQEAPYLWITDGASSQRSQLQKFLADRGWSTAELTAESPYPAWAAGEKGQAAAEKYGSFFSGEAMMDLLREEFGLDGSWSGEDARLVAGVQIGRAHV